MRIDRIRIQRYLTEIRKNTVDLKKLITSRMNC